MSRVTWGDPGSKTYETGLDRGVLYVDNAAYAWNGLTNVTEKASGGEAKPFYADGMKYLNLPSSEEFEATIEAFSAPPQFALCEGVAPVFAGLFVGQQPRKAFGLSYRTLIGNDLQGTNYAYKIHLVYNALAGPSERSNATLNDSPEGMSLSWDLTTLPPALTGYKPTAHLTIDSRTTAKGLLKAVEDILYGSDASDGRLPMPSELAAMFRTEGPTWRRNYVLNPSFRAASTYSEVWRNYVKNPMYRATSGSVERTRNLCVNPHPTTTTGYQAGGTMSVVPAPWNSARSAIQAPAAGTGTFYMFSANAEAGTIPSGTPVTVSGTIQVPAGKYYRVFVHTATGNYYYSFGTQPYVLSDGKPVRVSKTDTLTSDATDLNLAVLVYDNAAGAVLAAGSVCYIGDVMLQKSSILNPYFDGDTPASGDFTYAWLGTAKASASSQQGKSLTNMGVYGNAPMMQSTAWTRPGRTYSMRLASLYDFAGSGYFDLATLVGATTTGLMTLVKGNTYTVSGWFYSPPATPNTAGGITFTVLGVAGLGKTATVAPGGGEQFLSLTFTVPTDAAVTGVYVRIQNSLPRGVADLWVSDLMFVDGTTTPPFFDGSSQLGDGLTYSWSGAADASAPIAMANKTDNWSGSNGIGVRGPVVGSQFVMDLRKSSTYYSAVCPGIGVGDLAAGQVTLQAIPGESVPFVWGSVRIALHDGTNYITTSAYPQPLPADGSPVVLDLPASLAVVNANVRMYIYANNNSIRVSNVIIEKVANVGDKAGPFFDGSSPSGYGYFYHWDGTPDASTSYINTWN